VNLGRLWLFVLGWALIGSSLDHSLPHYIGWQNAVLYVLAGMAFTLGLCVTGRD
jgi:hypothetical protein